MIEQESYKSRAVAVRRSARARVLEIRRARIAKRKAAAGKVTEVAPDALAAKAADTVEPTEAELIDVIPTPRDESPSSVQAEPQSLSKKDPPVGELDDASVTNAAIEELSDFPHDTDDVDGTTNEAPERVVADQADASIETENMGENEAGPAVEMPDEQPDLPVITEAASELSEDHKVHPCEDEPASDLESLPGAGPGLIWMLHQCGVQSLADLADQDSAELSLKLGVVGQILNVEQWISFAKTSADAAEDVT